MEPTDLTCPKCGTTWKLIKAGDGPITCPNCKATMEQGPPVTPLTHPAPLAGTPPAPIATPAPAATAPDVSDVDDPGIGSPARARMPVPDVPRRRHPLVTVAVVLLLILLVPLALVACLFAVCAVMFRGM